MQGVRGHGGEGDTFEIYLWEQVFRTKKEAAITGWKRTLLRIRILIILQAPKLKESFQKSVLRITLRLEEIERKKLMLVSFQV